MNASLTVPTATSVRAVPAKLLADNRIVINNHLARSRGGKVSFTHLIGYALVRALDDFPNMNSAYAEVDGKPVLVQPEHVNFGLAIDLPKPDGSRSLVVASIKNAETLDFAGFWAAYEDVIRRARQNKLTMEDFTGTTISLTNPGTLGTNHSVPRLTAGQGAILGVGAMEYPAEFQGMNPDALTEMAVSKIITLTSTYDHRIIQGAESGDFLRRLHALLLGEDGFYDKVFRSLRIPYEPVRWMPDVRITREGQIDKEARVIEVIESYRRNGHLMADTDPLEFKVRTHPDLDILEHGLTLWDLDRRFPVGGFAGERLMPLRDILGVLRNSYCRTVGVEYMHITDPEEREWLQQRVEVKHEQPDRDKQKHVLGRLNAAEAFETFLQTKYVGQKRFSLEGGESVIPILDEVLIAGTDHGLDEVAIGMAHRGRLNILANVLGKSYEKIFGEFEGNIDPGTVQGSGDVKYHLGATGKFRNPFRTDAEIAVSLASNPSHLETVNPVLEGIVRAKQDMIDKGEHGFTVLPVLLHGDSAFAGQGVVAETLNLSQLRGYRTGGTVHVVINNQVGFTTSPTAARSSLYSTDVARMVNAPIFHVNGDDPEACVRVARLAVEYRQAFKKDVVIDLVCYRRRGHNEGDDPSMTQPQMYDIIDRKRSVRKLYTEALVGRGDITLAEAEEALKDYRGQLERAFAETHDAQDKSKPQPVMDRAHAPGGSGRTAITPEILKAIGDAHVSLPEDFHAAPEAAADAGAAGGDGQRGQRRLGDGRAAGLRLAAHGGRARAARRPGLPPRHLRAAALGAHRPGDRRGVHAAGAPHPGAGEVLRLRLAAQRVRGARLRVRLLGGQPEGARAVGGAVRRLRRRRPDGHRRVHQLRRGQVGPALRRRDAAAARPRGPGPRPLQRPDRAVPAAVGREQHDRRQLLDPRQLLPPAPPSGALGRAPAAGRVHAEVAAAGQGRGQRGRGLHRGDLPSGAARHRGRRGAAGRRRGAAGAAVQRQGRLRPDGAAGVRGHRRRRRRPGRAALPAAGRADPRAARAVPERQRRGVGAGGADEHGRLAVHGGQPARAPAGGPHVPPGQPPGIGQPRRRVRPRCTRSSSASWSPRPSPTEARHRVLHRSRAGGAGRPAGRGAGHPRLAGRPDAGVRRPVPRLRGARRAAGHLAGPRRHGRRRRRRRR